MARCWSCGAEIPGGWRSIFTCPICSQAEDVKRIRRMIESSGVESLSSAVAIIESGFGELSGQLSEIATIIEWGFEELSWKIDQTTGVLKNIDQTLKIPSATQANEWRQIAEELKRRDVLDESEKFFLQSLKTNPLDYRTYIGFGKTELQMGKFDEAKTLWEESFLHAPKGEIDYKSYSYRLIGRLHFCKEDYQQAASALKTAIELSPNYWLGHYDYAQYCAWIDDKQNCLFSLRTAILKEPIPLELVRTERNFKPVKAEVENLIKTIEEDYSTEIKARAEIRSIMSKIGMSKIGRRTGTVTQWEKARRMVEGAKEAIPRARRRDEPFLEYLSELCRGAQEYLKQAEYDAHLVTSCGEPINLIAGVPPPYPHKYTWGRHLWGTRLALERIGPNLSQAITYARKVIDEAI